MNGNLQTLPTLDEAKRQAKRLHGELVDFCTEIPHGRALELLAHQHGYRDWNTFHAVIGNGPPADENRPPRVGSPVQIGETARGTYLGQPCTGQVVSVNVLGRNGDATAR